MNDLLEKLDTSKPPYVLDVPIKYSLARGYSKNEVKVSFETYYELALEEYKLQRVDDYMRKVAGLSSHTEMFDILAAAYDDAELFIDDLREIVMPGKYWEVITHPAARSQVNKLDAKLSASKRLIDSTLESAYVATSRGVAAAA